MSAAGLRPSPTLRRKARHREELTLALREGLSLDQAGRRLARIRWAATMSRLSARRAAAATAPTDGAHDQAPRFWWLDR